MNHITAELDQTEEDILNEVSDETLEAAAGTYIGGQFYVTSDQRSWWGDAANLGSQATAKGLLTALANRAAQPALQKLQGMAEENWGYK